MPPRQVYWVDFRNSNVTPYTCEDWGPLAMGGSPNGRRTTSPTPRGLELHMTREAGDRAPASNSVYVLPPERSLLLDSRFRLRASFEQPAAEWLPGSAVGPENWAIGLQVKLTREVDLDPETEPCVAMTCEFRRTALGSGVRLCGVNDQQGDAGDYVDSPIDYRAYRADCFGIGRAPRFTLELNFCGRQASYAVASSSLSIVDRTDHRVLSTRRLSGGPQNWIGAIGVSLATSAGVGRYRARLLDLIVSRWDEVR